MEVNKIQEELARLIELVDGWAGSHDVPGIERDLVLDKLKKLYEAIRFANFDEGDSSASASVAAQQSVAEVAPVSEISIDLDDLLAEPVRDFLPESAAMPEALDAPVGESAAVPEPGVFREAGFSVCRYRTYVGTDACCCSRFCTRAGSGACRRNCP